MKVKFFQIFLLIAFSVAILGGCDLFFDGDREDFLEPPGIIVERWAEEIKITFDDDEEWRENIQEVRVIHLYEPENEENEKDVAALLYLPDYEVEEGKIIAEKPDPEDGKPFNYRHIPRQYWDEDDLPLIAVEVASRGYYTPIDIFPLKNGF